MDSPEIPTSPETEPIVPAAAHATAPLEAAPDSRPATIPEAESAQNPPETRFLLWVLLGSQGLRAGWSIAMFVILFFVFSALSALVLTRVHVLQQSGHTSAQQALWGELTAFIGVVGAAALVALAERRGSPLAYNLRGPHRASHFFQGFVAGFAALSALVAALHFGGWLNFGPIALSGADVFKFAALWAIAFLLVGCVEEGLFRCYLQFTLTRSINFWWALGIIALLCADLALRAKGNGVWGVYSIALLGLVPCLLLHLRKASNSGFWQASWVTSTVFGFVHTGNNGENWIGIFAAAAIGFVFVVSIRVTGSAWWAIGCHASWDWAETYFYGTADSGFIAAGHYLSTAVVTPAGQHWAVLWSGGADGPEGSLLVIPIILLLLLALIVLYGRRKPVAVQAAAGLELPVG